MKRIFPLLLALALSLSLLSATASAADDPAFSDIPPTTFAPDRAVYSFYYAQSDGAWVLTGVGNQRNDLTLF